MFRKGAMVLTIEGKVKQRTIKQMTNNYTLQENQGWFFVDYASEEVPLASRFDVLLEGESKRLLPGSISIKLVSCLDQFGNRLSTVPQGWKTICKFEFHPHIPSVIKKLPYFDGWDYNPQSISIANHEEIELGVSDVILYDLYDIIFIQFKTSIGKFPKKIYKKDLVYSLEKFLTPHSIRAVQLLKTWIQLGKVTEKSNDELELVEDNRSAL
jgi:hypothetical protein